MPRGLYTHSVYKQCQHLEPGGILSITRWIKTPPRDGLKIFATVIEALEQTGIKDPGRRLAMIRSWNTSTLLVKNEPFTGSAIDSLKAFSRERWFDLVYCPGITRDEVKPRHVLIY